MIKLSRSSVKKMDFYHSRSKKIKINPKIKPLYASFLKLGIGKYLISQNFKFFTKKNLIDEAWDSCLTYIIRSSNVGIFVPGYTGDDEEAFELFLSHVFGQTPKKQFIRLIGLILSDFINWSNKKIKLNEVKRGLIFLGYGEAEIDSIFSQIKPNE